MHKREREFGSRRLESKTTYRHNFTSSIGFKDNDREVLQGRQVVPRSMPNSITY